VKEWLTFEWEEKVYSGANGLKEKPTESATSVRCKKRKGTSDVEAGVRTRVMKTPVRQ